MHAMLVVTKMDPTKHDAQRRELEERIVPIVKQAPGFISGTWMIDRGDGRASSMIVLDTEEGARQFAAMLQQQAASGEWAAKGVSLESSLVGEVQAHPGK